MFVAKSQSGKFVSVLNEPISYIKKLKGNGPFYCPDCKQEVILKIGKRKISHFAHKSLCPAKGEGETEGHLMGKVLLYQWLKGRGFNPEMEKYLPSLNQRPDLFVRWKEKDVAVEFQCSVLPDQMLSKRTEQYEKNGILPVWILHENIIRKKSPSLIHLTDFPAAFIQNIGRSQPTLISLDPKGEIFYSYTHFLPYSRQRAYAVRRAHPLKEANWKDFWQVPKTFEFYDRWPELTEKWLFTRTLRKQATSDLFVLYFYRHGIHPTMFPPEVGIPLPDMYFIANAPFEWQAYLWHRFIFEKKPGDSFTMSEVNSFLFEEMGRHITWRYMPLLKNRSKLLPVHHYFHFLFKVGFLSKEGERLKINKPGTLIRQPGEKGFFVRRDFFRKYKGVLLKNFWLTHQ